MPEEKQIDWSKAPEGATHYLPETDRYRACWAKEGYSMRCGTQDAWISDELDSVRHLMIPRPTVWNGEGLPPVGMVCELQQEVLRLFSYDPKTGSLKWKENQQKRFVGREAGSINHHGYRRVNLGKTKLHAHQIIWLMHHGELPDCEIDHINGVRDDNRLENLRLATQQKNQQNAGLRIDNALGVKGVRLRPSGNYQARVKLSDGSRAVKTFCTVIEAVSWLAMQREMSHGDYANTPEQIAAEEREKQRDYALNWMTAHGSAKGENEAMWQQRLLVVREMLDMDYRRSEVEA